MIIVKYKNENGTLVFGSGSNMFPFKIIEITGLSLVPKKYKVNEYAFVPGQISTYGIEPARTITIKADIKKCDAYVLANANRILSEPGELFIYAGTKKRKIKCRCEDFVAEERRKVYQPIVVQLICDNPFFEDVELRSVCLFERKNLIKGSFTLPCVFTTRVQRVNVVNHGQRETEPVIMISCVKEGNGSEYGIVLKNHTTDTSFTLNYQMSMGEEVIIDFKNRKITSNMPCEDNNNGDLLYYMSNDSFMSKFKLKSGVNDIEHINLDSSSETVALCEYSSRYIEAVI